MKKNEEKEIEKTKEAKYIEKEAMKKRTKIPQSKVQ